jgi:transcription initiation factor TFIIB
VKSKERALDFEISQAFFELQALSKRLGLPEPIFRSAFRICKDSIEKGLVGQKKCSGMTLAAIYASCRMNDFPITLKTLSSTYRRKKVDWRDIAFCYRIFVNELNLKMPVADPERYLTQIGSSAHISQTAIDVSAGIIRNARNSKDSVAIEGKDPTAVAAAALYTACLALGETTREKDLADAAGVTEAAIRHSLRALRRMRFVGKDSILGSTRVGLSRDLGI